MPQLWAIFTEVQRYYDAGFTVPDDVTLLFCDNNWGYIRRKGTTPCASSWLTPRWCSSISLSTSTDEG